MGFTTEQRIEQLKHMHELMALANNENIYMKWITLGVPDCPMEDDFEFIAEDNDRYNETVDLFCELVKRKSYRY